MPEVGGGQDKIQIGEPLLVLLVAATGSTTGAAGQQQEQFKSTLSVTFHNFRNNQLSMNQ